MRIKHAPRPGALPRYPTTDDGHAYSDSLQHFAESINWNLIKDTQGLYQLDCGLPQDVYDRLSVDGQAAINSGMVSVLGKKRILNSATQSSMAGSETIGGGDIPPSEMSSAIKAFENSRRKVSIGLVKAGSRATNYITSLQVVAAMGDGLIDKAFNVSQEAHEAVERCLADVNAGSYADTNLQDRLVEYSENPDELLRFAIRNAKRDFWASTQYQVHKNIAELAGMSNNLIEKLYSIHDLDTVDEMRDHLDRKTADRRMSVIKSQSKMDQCTRIRDVAAKLATSFYGLPPIITEGLTKMGAEIWKVSDEATASQLEEQMTEVLAESRNSTVLDEYFRMAKADPTAQDGHSSKSKDFVAPQPVIWEEWMGGTPPQPKGSAPTSKGTGKKTRRAGKVNSKKSNMTAADTDEEEGSEPRTTWTTVDLHNAFTALDADGRRALEWKSTTDRLSKEATSKRSEWLTRYWTDRVAQTKQENEERKARRAKREAKAKERAQAESAKASAKRKTKSKKNSVSSYTSDPADSEIEPVDWTDIRRTLYLYSHLEDPEGKHFVDQTPESFLQKMIQDLQDKQTDISNAMMGLYLGSSIPETEAQLQEDEKPARIPGTRLLKAPAFPLGAFPKLSEHTSVEHSGILEGEDVSTQALTTDQSTQVPGDGLNPEADEFVPGNEGGTSKWSCSIFPMKVSPHTTCRSMEPYPCSNVSKPIRPIHIHGGATIIEHT